MELNEYSAVVRPLSRYPGQGSLLGLVYCALGVAGESGEYVDKIKKFWRDANQEPCTHCNGTGREGGVDLDDEMTDEQKQAKLKELGDILWYVDNSAKELDFTLDDVAQANIDKLLDRRARGAMHGSGDDR